MGKVKFTGLTQNSQVDPAVWLKIPIRALELAHILGQPCECQVSAPVAHMHLMPTPFASVSSLDPGGSTFMLNAIMGELAGHITSPAQAP